MRIPTNKDKFYNEMNEVLSPALPGSWGKKKKKKKEKKKKTLSQLPANIALKVHIFFFFF